MHNPGWKQYATKGWDKAPPPQWLIEQCLGSARKAIIWGGNYFALPPRMGWLIWDKGQRDFSLADVEMAWTSEDKAARAFDYSRARAKNEGKEHQTQKPVPLMQWSILQMGDVQTILDPFAGTGTTGIAAKNLGKRCVLIEREEAFCEIIVRRLAQDVLAFGGEGLEREGETASGEEPREGHNEKDQP